MVARKKPSKPAEHRWQISLIKATPAKYLGSVDAPDEVAAIKAAAREFKIDDTLKNRLVARAEPAPQNPFSTASTKCRHIDATRND